MPNVNQGLPTNSFVPAENSTSVSSVDQSSPALPQTSTPSQPTFIAPTPIPPTPTTTLPPQPGFVESIGSPVTPATPIVPLPLSIARWVTVLALTVIGAKGFLDALYFNTIEFQNFEKAFEEHLVETQLINQLILKAVLLIVSTALSVFFAMQLSIFSRKGPQWLRVIFSMMIAIICVFVLQYASTIHVVDVLR